MSKSNLYTMPVCLSAPELIANWLDTVSKGVDAVLTNTTRSSTLQVHLSSSTLSTCGCLCLSVDDCFFFCVSMCLCVYIIRCFVYRSVCGWSVWRSVGLYVCLSLGQSVCLSVVNLSMCLFACLCLSISVCLSLSLSLSVCLSVGRQSF